MKVALVYDRVNKWGGAERVLLALHRIFPEAPLFTSVYEQRLTPWASGLFVRTSFLQKLPLPKDRHELYPFLMGLAFETLNFDDYDVVVSVTSEFGKAVITKPKTLHVCYCLNPTGYLWSGYAQYFSSRGSAFRAIASPMVKYLRWYDKIVANRPDRYVAITKAVADRIKKYYNRDSDLIYPPVTVEASPSGTDEGYFLVVSRLVPNKRVDIAVAAFSELGWPLKVVGVGVEEGRLRRMSKNNVEFLGSLTDEEMKRYYRCCTGLVIAGEEDFGIVAVEAQSFGKPVLAYGAGGVRETVVEGKTGWFFPEQRVSSLVKKAREIKNVKLSSNECFQNAQRFSEERFGREFKSYINESWVDYKRGQGL